MPIAIRQSAGATVGAGTFKSIQVLLDQPTLPNSMIWVVATATHPRENTLAFLLGGPSGFTQLSFRREDKLSASVWVRYAAPATSKIAITTLGETYGIQLRVIEFTGVAQSNVLDKVTVRGDNIEGRPGSDTPNSGTTGTLGQSDELLIGFIVNRYGNTTQSGFTGGLARISETLSASSEPNHDRTRLTLHAATATTTAAATLAGRLSSRQDWIAGLFTFRSGSLGAARMTSTTAAPIVSVGGRGDLTAFGPLASKVIDNTLRFVAGEGVQARMGPFNYQYRLGGWSGLLIGDDTPYQVENHNGLEGWQLRTSDDEFPRGDGALRGVDLQTARQILFELKIGSDSAGANAQQVDVEDAMDTLYRALVPQRDADWELIWRHPGRPLRLLRCRPVDLIRELDVYGTVVNFQKFALLAADPRHYGALVKKARFAASPLQDGTDFTPVLNDGNSFAYPLIRVTGPSSDSVQRIQLTNQTYDLSWAVEATLPTGSTLQGDMEARATGANRSIVTIDGQNKYGAWQFPRDTFLLGPGENRLRLTTVPANTSVMCGLEFRDTWNG